MGSINKMSAMPTAMPSRTPSRTRFMGDHDLIAKYRVYSNRPARKKVGLQLALSNCFATAVRKMYPQNPGLRVNDPHFFGAMCEILLHFRVEPGRGIRL